MARFVVFIPYFGKLPLNFDLWSTSCSFNKQFLFYVFTDDKRTFSLPDNVKIIYQDLDTFSKLVSSKFGLNVSITNPYKLCDLKPFYGYIFSEYLDGFDYWGYCDIDLIFGDLSSFLPKNLNEYYKIGTLGHFCLIKNDRISTEFFKLPVKSLIGYKDIICSGIHFGFDEIGDYGVNAIFRENNLAIYPFEENIADITSQNEGMVISRFENGHFNHVHGKRIFSFENGHIFSNTIEEKGITKTEFSYVHFQKRDMKMNLIGKPNSFLIYPHSFERFQSVTTVLIKKSQPLFAINVFHLFKLKTRSLIVKRKRKKYLSNKKIIYEK